MTARTNREVTASIGTAVFENWLKAQGDQVFGSQVVVTDEKQKAIQEALKKPKRAKRTVTTATRYVEEWAPQFGFGHYHWRVLPLPAKFKNQLWACAAFEHDEEWFEIQIVPDDVLPDAQVEHLVLHELGHGLFEMVEQGDELALEQAVNRVVRLAGGAAGSSEFTWGKGRWSEEQGGEVKRVSCSKRGSGSS